MSEETTEHSGGRSPIAPFDSRRSTELLQSDAERYCELALDLGADDCRVIRTDEITLDERVQFKCSVPKCFGYGTCANCPPHSPSVELMRRVIPRYSTALVLKRDVRPEAIVRDRETIDERVEAYKTMFSVVGALESAAFYDGHHLAVGFAAGSCKSTFCHKSDCAVLLGQKCRHNLLARPSMEAVGIDCFLLAESLGWSIAPIGSAASASCVPSGMLMGLVLLA